MEVYINGSKPNYLVGGYDLENAHTKGLMDKVKQVLIKRLQGNDVVDFCCNGQLGIPQMVFNLLLEMKREGKYANLGKLKLVLACDSLSEKWFGKSLAMHLEHLKYADEVVYVDKELGITQKSYGVKLRECERYILKGVTGVIVVSHKEDESMEKFISEALHQNKKVAQIDSKTYQVKALALDKIKEERMIEEELKHLKFKQDYLRNRGKYKKAVLDTETNGLIESLGYTKVYPDIAQLSYILLDEENRVESYKNYYFKLESMSPGAEKVHGLSLEKLEVLSGGKTLEDYKEEILKDLEGREFICHNVEFDKPVMQNACKVSDLGKKSLCTMEWYKDVLKLPSKRYEGYKRPKLSEVAEFVGLVDEEVLEKVKACYGSEEVSYHDSRYDTMVTLEIYKQIERFMEE